MVVVVRKMIPRTTAMVRRMVRKSIIRMIVKMIPSERRGGGDDHPTIHSNHVDNKHLNIHHRPDDDDFPTTTTMITPTTTTSTTIPTIITMNVSFPTPEMEERKLPNSWHSNRKSDWYLSVEVLKGN